MNSRRIVAFLILVCSAGTFAQAPEWIWHPNTNAITVYFRKTFRTPPLIWNSRLTVAADDRAELFLNGVQVATCSDWRNPTRSEVTVRLNQGENVIAIKASNHLDQAGLLVHFNLNGETNVLSDSTWLVNTNEEPNWSILNFSASHWSPALSLGQHGMQPWGDVLFRAAATPAESIEVMKGFKVELLRSAQTGEGSWICMTFDDRGRAIVSPQGQDRPLLRMTLAGNEVAKIEPIQAPIRYAMGMLQAFESLYVNGIGPQGSGLYRLIDTNKNDQYETNELHFLKRFEGGSEHGYHALALGRDNKIYVLNGNGTKLPAGIATNSPYRNFAEDALTGDGNSKEEEDGSKAPACYVLRTDSEGREWELWAGGMRNAYDFDFNADGELFTFDSDMEWDWGTPWYRPTRVLHLVSGGEYGWRDGTRMWSDDYPDGLAAATAIGIGSPTGVKFGTRSQFPEKYRRALYVLDWSYGRILAVHLDPNQSTYKGKWEAFVTGKPLNLTSIAFGSDGAMYFVTGGRGTQSGLYRVSYAGPRDLPQVSWGRGARFRDDRTVRHRLEELHRGGNSESLQFILKQIYQTDDPWNRFAGRVALETYPADLWEREALVAKPSVPEGLATVWLAVMRVGSPEIKKQLLQRMAQFPDSFLPKLRAIELMLARGPVSPNESEAIIADLNNSYPAKKWPVNRELSRILLQLHAPDSISKTIRLLQKADTQEEQMHYIEQLRNVHEGWTLDDRRTFFGWFQKPRDPKAHPAELRQYFKDVGRDYVDGAWFNKYLRDFRREAIATLSAQERDALGAVLAEPVVPALNVPASERQFVQDWRLEDLLPNLEKNRKPNLKRGRQAFVDAQCLACHRLGNDGGMSGPELTGAGSKYSARDLLESLVEPSKIVSDQYQNHTVILKDGDSITGRLISESQQEIVLETDRLTGAKEKIPRNEASELRPATVSPMPKGLINNLSKEEILDLIAYIRSGGA